MVPANAAFDRRCWEGFSVVQSAHCSHKGLRSILSTHTVAHNLSLQSQRLRHPVASMDTRHTCDIHTYTCDCGAGWEMHVLLTFLALSLSPFSSSFPSSSSPTIFLSLCSWTSLVFLGSAVLPAQRLGVCTHAMVFFHVRQESSLWGKPVLVFSGL